MSHTNHDLQWSNIACAKHGICKKVRSFLDLVACYCRNHRKSCLDASAKRAIKKFKSEELPRDVESRILKVN